MKKSVISLITVICMMVCFIPSCNIAYAAGTADDIVSIAKGQLGYTETGNNIVKYWNDLGYSSMQGSSWCAAFVVWCARKAGIGADVIPTAFSSYAATNSMRNFYLNKGTYYYRGSTTPRKGDIIIFNHGHTGLVTGADSNKVYTIEGNVSNSVSSQPDTVATRSYSLSNSDINGYGRPAYKSSTKPTNVSLEKNQNWYDIKDIITLTPKSNGATSYYMSICNSATNKPVIQTGLSGSYSVAASKLGYGDYYAWISASNSAGSTDSATIKFSVVGAAGYNYVYMDKRVFTTNETVAITVSTVCAKGQVIGIDKVGQGRVVTETCNSTYTIAASKLGVGNYSAYFSVWNGSGGVDTKSVTFSIINPVNLGNDFYAFIINTASWKMVTNDNTNVSLRAEIPADKQKWHFIRQSDGSYKIYSLLGGKRLDVYNASPDSGANIGVYTDNGSNAQQWYIYGDSGSYRLAAKCSSNVMDLNGGYTTDGTNVRTYISNNTAAQKFSIYRIDDKAPTYSKLSTNKTSYTSGENVQFTLRSDYATSFNITVSKNGTSVWSSNVHSDVTKAFTDPGNYTAVMTAKNAKSSVKSNTVKFTVIKNVTGVSLNKTSTTIEKGKSETLTATVAPSNATNKSVTWSSSNTNVATVSNGVVTAKSAGTATITVKTADGSKTATCKVTVKNPTVSVTGVSLNKTSTTIETGKSETLTATVTPSNATNKSVTWSSSNTNVATVSNGVVTAKSAGTATITVKTADGSKTATCKVTVKNPTVSVTGVSLNKTSTTIETGKSETLTATVTPSNATNKSVTWSSSNTNVATVSNGVVTAKSVGTATITVKTADGSKTATCTITVPEITTDYDGNITVSEVTGSACATIDVPVSISENPGIAGFSFNMKYDKSVLTPVSISKGSALTDGTLNSNINQGGDLSKLENVTVYWSNPSNITNNGDIFIVRFKVNDDAESGTYPITVSYQEGDITNQTFDNVNPRIIYGSVTISSVKKGDIYADGAVNTKDGVMLSQYLAKWDLKFSASQIEAADVYEDGTVNTKDGVKLSQVLAKWDNVTLASDDTALESANNIAVNAKNVTANAGEYVDVPIEITENSGIAGFNFNIEYDKSRLRPVSIKAGDILSDGTFTSNIQQSGDVSNVDYVTSYWNNPSDITGTGTLFTVRFKVDENATGEIPVTVTYNEGDICNQNFENVSADITNGVVNVRDVAVSEFYKITSATMAKDNEVTESIPQNGDFTITAEVNEVEKYDSAKLYAVLYDENGALVSFINTDVNNSGSYNITVPQIDKTIGKVKLFIWNSLDGMKPLSKVFTIE